MLATPVPSHLTPLLPLVWALRGAGHQVLLGGQPDLEGVATAGGLSMAVLGTEEQEVRKRLAVRAAGRPDAGGAGGSRQEPPWDSLAERWRGRLESVTGPALELARSWRPDLIVADPLEHASLLVGGVLDIPVVHHRWGVDSFSTRSFGRVRDALAEICARYGLADGLPAPTLVLDPCPPGLQDPDAAPGLPLRFVPSNGAGTVPAWAADRRAERRVCLSLGLRTLALEGPHVLTGILAALGSLEGVETVATVERQYREGLVVPPSVRLVDPAPISLFLDTCDAVVHHGGTGTGLTAIAAGLPQLVLPQTPWTAEHGERIAATGAGLHLPDTEAPGTEGSGAEGQDGAGRIADAVRRLLDEPEFGAGARRLGEEMARTPSPADVLPHLERLAARGGVRPAVQGGSSA
ncbi:DUF1205 domain-containing protein [Streptomyces sp. BG9H]|uniref:DUF1205 domain-containing protein n=1 Tax=Streptomyces anatolicus TaxID=2675858 RepID=A0ABS6YUZ2_9ACTN|nr:DUF1205 domain-containing protein [Streptomyces anatolicus]